MSLVGIEDAVGEPVGAGRIVGRGRTRIAPRPVEWRGWQRARPREQFNVRRAKVRHQPEACNRKKMARPSKTAKRG
jgi:hypothetical protein